MTLHSVFEDQAAPSLFEGINARYYRTAEVTRSFVPNEQFANLAVRQHSLIVGPRGSGKTTLLRMLHPESLDVWQHEEADRYREDVTFSGVYVATDRVWREQLDAATTGLSVGDRDILFSTVVGIDIMLAVVRTLQHRTGRRSEVSSGYLQAELAPREIARLVKELAAGWQLTPQFLDLGSLRVALRRRRMEARQWIQGRRDGSGMGSSPPWLELPWDDAFLLAIDAFEATTGRHGEPWALLFDEAEIAPANIRDSVLRSTRGMDPRLLVKCSLSPWLPGTGFELSEHGPSVFNDYNVIKLFYGRRTESYEFSRDLIRARLAASGRPLEADAPVEDQVFGSSRFMGESSGLARTAPAYSDDSALGQVVKELAKIDPNFRGWLTSVGISPGNLDAVSEKLRSETLRKARNIMIARLEFRRQSGQLRSRKTIAMYTGGATMLDICEGNPRLLLGLLLPLLEFYDGVHPIPAQLQADALGQIADDFYALIDAIPVAEEIRSPVELGRRRLRNPYREVIDRTARFFQDQTLRGEFNPQPPSSFRVPSTTSSALQALIGRLVNVGAIIMIPDRGVKDVVVGAFDQHRMRLCYLVAAREHLPPNVDRPVSIRRVLAKSAEVADALPGLDSAPRDDVPPVEEVEEP